jgi:hypothetical protein
MTASKTFQLPTIGCLIKIGQATFDLRRASWSVMNPDRGDIVYARIRISSVWVRLSPQAWRESSPTRELHYSQTAFLMYRAECFSLYHNGSRCIADHLVCRDVHSVGSLTAWPEDMYSQMRGQHVVALVALFIPNPVSADSSAGLRSPHFGHRRESNK